MKPKLFESLMQQHSEQRLLYEQLKQRTEHPFIKRYVQTGIKEGFFSDVANALGRMHDTLVPAAWPALIGRSIIRVMPTSEAMERFPLDVDAVAYEYAEGAKTRLSGKKVSTVDINTDILADASEEWMREFLAAKGIESEFSLSKLTKEQILAIELAERLLQQEMNGLIHVTYDPQKHMEPQAELTDQATNTYTQKQANPNIEDADSANTETEDNNAW